MMNDRIRNLTKVPWAKDNQNNPPNITKYKP